MAYKSNTFEILSKRIKLYSSFPKNTQEGWTRYIGAYFDLSKNKGCEINLYFALAARFNLSAAYTTKCDHAGLIFELDLFGLQLEINIYDCRHWNRKANRWYLPGEEAAELEANGPDIQYGNVNLLDEEE